MPAEVPGFAASDPDTDLEGRRSSISAKREKHEERKDKKMICPAASSSRILRLVELLAGLKAEDAQAPPNGGILMLEFPKTPPAKTIVVTGKSG